MFEVVDQTYSFFIDMVMSVVGTGRLGKEIDGIGGIGRDGNGPVGRGMLKDGNGKGPSQEQGEKTAYKTSFLKEYFLTILVEL